MTYYVKHEVRKQGSTRDFKWLGVLVEADSEAQASLAAKNRWNEVGYETRNSIVTLIDEDTEL